jgi:hypothetical protein
MEEGWWAGDARRCRCTGSADLCGNGEACDADAGGHKGVCAPAVLTSLGALLRDTHALWPPRAPSHAGALPRPRRRTPPLWLSLLVRASPHSPIFICHCHSSPLPLLTLPPTNLAQTAPGRRCQRRRWTTAHGAAASPPAPFCPRRGTSSGRQALGVRQRARPTAPRPRGLSAGRGMEAGGGGSGWGGGMGSAFAYRWQGLLMGGMGSAFAHA